MSGRRTRPISNRWPSGRRRVRAGWGRSAAAPPLPALASFVVAALVAGCAAGPGPRPIRAGTPCDACGMGIQDMRFACEREDGGRYRFYDSIECLLRDQAGGGEAWLPDYDQAVLHAADSIWVVRGNLPSPMGGGYAAFMDRAAAEEVAARSDGRVARLSAFARGGEGRP